MYNVCYGAYQCPNFALPYTNIRQGAPASIGAALCGVLANLAIEEDFRESFAVNATSSSKGGKDHGQPSPARTLVLVAGDNKVKVAEWPLTLLDQLHESVRSRRHDRSGRNIDDHKGRNNSTKIPGVSGIRRVPDLKRPKLFSSHASFNLFYWQVLTHVSSVVEICHST